MKQFSTAFIPFLCIALTACGTAGDGNNGGVTGGQGDFNQYEENLETAADIAAGIRSTSRLDVAPTQDTASMSGVFAIDTTSITPLGIPGELVGEMTMNADFGNSTVSGQLHNTFLDYGSTQDPLTGSMQYNGDIEVVAGETVSSGIDGVAPQYTDVDAHGEATFTAPDGTTYNVFADLFGDVHEVPDLDPTTPDPILAVNGLIEGNVTITDPDDATNPLIYDMYGNYIVHE